MKKFLSILLSAVLAFSGILIASPKTALAADEYPLRAGDYDTAPDNDVLMGIEGEFVSVDEEDKVTLLARINEIREEACDEGVPDPRDRSRALTPGDYSPLRWSEVLELVAAMRTTESSVVLAHQRLASDTNVWSYGYSPRCSNGENLAWNYSNPTLDAILYGINQWYGEKDDWVNNTAGAVTGHYTSMINPNMKYIGLAGFYNNAAKYPMTVANHLSMSSGLSEITAGIGGKVSQITRVAKSKLTALTLSGPAFLYVGETGTAKNRATVSETTGLGTSYGAGPVVKGITYTSSAPSVVSVDENGELTAHAAGTATITASIDGNLSATHDVEVLERNFSSDVRFSGAGVTLNNDLSIRFSVPAAPFTGASPEATDPYVTVEFLGKTTEIRTYTTSQNSLLFRFNHVTPLNMTDVMKVTLYAKKNGTYHKAAVMEYSIADYCYDALNYYGNISGYETLRTLLVDTLRYGTEAQKYFNHNTDNLADARLTATQRAWGSSGFTIGDDYQLTNTGFTDLTFEGATLVLEEGITIRLIVNAADLTGLTMEVSGPNGKTWTIPSSDFKSRSDGTYAVDFRGAHPYERADRFTFTAYRNGDIASPMLRYSIRTYVYNSYSNSELYNIVRAIGRYCDSAKAYADSK